MVNVPLQHNLYEVCKIRKIAWSQSEFHLDQIPWPWAKWGPSTEIFPALSSFIQPCYRYRNIIKLFLVSSLETLNGLWTEMMSGAILSIRGLEGFLKRKVVLYWIALLSTVETLYNTINFCWSTHKRHSIARPKGQGMGCLLWVQRATYCVDLSILSSIKYLL